MSTDPPSHPDRSEREWARQNPKDAVDALEREVLGGPEHRLDGGYPDDLSPTEQNDVHHDPEEPEAAFALDVDPEDQGSPAVTPRNPN